MSRKSTVIGVLEDFKFWYPEGFNEDMQGQCNVCGTMDNRGLGEITNGREKDQIGEKGRQRWVSLCRSCWLKWKKVSRDHVIAWELSRAE